MEEAAVFAKPGPVLGSVLVSIVVALSLPACAREPKPAGPVLRLATTTSTVDTGLLRAILPEFEAQRSCRVDVVAVGTGQALELGRRGDADVLLGTRPSKKPPS